VRRDPGQAGGLATGEGAELGHEGDDLGRQHRPGAGGGTYAVCLAIRREALRDGALEGLDLALVGRQHRRQNRARRACQHPGEMALQHLDRGHQGVPDGQQLPEFALFLGAPERRARGGGEGQGLGDGAGVEPVGSPIMPRTGLARRPLSRAKARISAGCRQSAGRPASVSATSRRSS